MTDLRPRNTSRYGWRPDLPDSRDHLYSVPHIALAALPNSVDLRSVCPPVYDQEDIGSCTANAIGAAFEFDLLKQKLPDFMPSRLFIYYNERVIEGTVNSDAGACIRDGMKSVHQQGVCPEGMWPYGKPSLFDRPSQECYDEALKHHSNSYHRVTRTLDQLRGCLASGYPFVFGFTVYESFESKEVNETGIAPMPVPNEAALGGHAVLAVGYDDSSQRFLVRNSWGPGWGMNGYFTMPYAYLTTRGLSSDFWCMQTVISTD